MYPIEVHNENSTHLITYISYFEEESAKKIYFFFSKINNLSILNFG